MIGPARCAGRKKTGSHLKNKKPGAQRSIAAAKTDSHYRDSENTEKNRNHERHCPRSDRGLTQLAEDFCWLSHPKVAKALFAMAWAAVIMRVPSLAPRGFF